MAGPAAAPAPAAMVPPPGAPREPAPRTTVPGEAPPPAKPAINVAAKYREIGTIRLMAMIFMLITAALSILSAPIIMAADTGSEGVTLSFLGIGLTILAVVFGFIAIINQKNRRLNDISTITAISLMIAGVAARPAILSLGHTSLDSTDFILALLFAIFFLFFLEYTHGVRRFWEIGHMAIEKNLKDFDFGHVLRQYIVMGFVWFVVAILLALAIVGVQLAMQNYLPAQLGQSAEMMSVYGLAVAEGIVFVILGLILSFFLGRKDYAQSFRAGTGAMRAQPKAEAAAVEPVQVVARQSTGLSATAPPPRAQ
jgi:hypothetical protein